MATFVDHTDLTSIGNGFSFDFMNASFSGTLTPTSLPLSFSISSDPGTLLLGGTSFANPSPGVYTGTVTSFDLTFDGAHLYTLSGLNISLQTLLNALDSGNPDTLFNTLYAGDDTFNLTHADQSIGNALAGGGGNDTFNYGDGWCSTEGGVIGGIGNDTLVLSGAYASPIDLMLGTNNLVAGLVNLVGVETVRLTAGNDYTIVKDGAFEYGVLTIDGSALGATDVLIVDRPISDQYGIYTILGGAAGDALVGADHDFGDTINGNGGGDEIYGEDGDDTLNGGDGNDHIFAGFDNDTVNGGAGNDTIDLTDGGEDVANGGVGNDTILLSTEFGSSFNIDGGAGTDTARLSGSFGTLTATLNAAFLNMEKFILDHGGLANINITNAVVAAGKTLEIDARAMSGSERINVNGTAELNGKLFVRGGGGADTITGGGVVDTLQGNGGADVLDGGKGSDVLTGGASSDIFLFKTALGASNVDQITDFNVPADTIQLENAIFKKVGAVGNLNAAAFWKGASAHDANDRIIYNAANGALLYDADGTGAGAAIRFATLSTGLNLTNADFVVI